MSDFIGEGFCANRDTVVKIQLHGSDDGIIKKIEFKIFSDKDILQYILNTISLGACGLLAQDMIEEINATNIIAEFDIEEEEEYLAFIVEEALKKAIINYTQKVIDDGFYYEEDQNE